jgi:hypothetical protein
MRFEGAYGGWQSKRLTQEEAAQLLGKRYSTARCASPAPAAGNSVLNGG